MRRFIVFVLSAAFILGLGTQVFAAERPVFQKAFGGIKVPSADDTASENNVVIKGAATVITGISFSAGGSASTFSLYDGNARGDVLAVNGIFEASAAANTGTYINLIDAPIRTKNGVVVVTDGNERGIIIYTQQATP